MNPSRPFILRPVATSLLMVAILLAGIVAYRVLPLSALPQVDYPTIQVVTLYPGASPEVMTSSITAPLERQFGQMPGLNQMSSTSSGGASVITLQFSLDLPLDVAEQEVQAAINAAATCLPADLPQPPVYSKVNPADTPIADAGARPRARCRCRRSRTSPTPGSRRRSRSCPASAWSASAAGSGRRCASRPIRRRSPPTTSRLEDVRTAIGNANVNQAKGSFDGPTRAYTIDANDQLRSADELQGDDRRLSQRRAGAPVPTWPTSSTAPRTRASRRGRTTSPAIILNIQRQPGANVIDVVDRIKALLPQLKASLPAAVDVAMLTDRTDDHPRLGARRAVRAAARRRAGRDGHLPVPAQRRGDRHPERGGAAVAGRHLRRHVPRRLLHQQPHADGAHHRDRLRRRRRDRDDREHRALHRGGRAAAARRRSRARSRSASPSSR